ncbi:hypothetical protein KAT92_03995 [Candidatus Babeliales bacterium]|nr:hypothetical protein [Candidatus Babeliales bacterium]
MKKITLSLLLLCTIFASARASEFSTKDISNILDNQEVESILDQAFITESKGAMAGLTIATAGAASMSLGYVFYKKLKAIDPDTTDPILLKKRKQFLALAWIFGLGGGVVTATGVSVGFSGNKEELTEESFDVTFEEDSTEEITDDESGTKKKKKKLRIKNPLKKKKKEGSGSDTDAIVQEPDLD